MYNLCSRSKELSEKLSILSSCVVIINAVFGCYQFQGISSNLTQSFITYNFQLDFISVLMVGLTGFIFLLCFIFEYKEKFFSLIWINSLLILQLFLVIAFSTSNFFIFFMTFEFILCPTFLLIGFFGSRGRRFHAAMLFFIYTFVSSIFLLTGFLVLTLF